MAQRSRAQYKTTKNARYADNTSGDVSAGDSRDMFEDTADSFINITDDAYTSFGVTAAGTDTYTATLSPAITAYSSGQRFLVKFTNANTGAATLNFNTVGAKSIVKNGSTALAAGDIAAGQTYMLYYDGTNLQIVGNVSTSASTTIASGTYTPTGTGVANVSAITENECQYLRVGNTVTVSGEVNITPTAGSTTTTLRLTLPIASNLANEHECAGTANKEGGNIAGIMKGDTTNDEVFLKFFNDSGTVSAPWFFSFTYRII